MPPFEGRWLGTTETERIEGSGEPQPLQALHSQLPHTGEP